MGKKERLPGAASHLASYTKERGMEGQSQPGRKKGFTMIRRYAKIWVAKRGKRAFFGGFNERGHGGDGGKVS